MGDLLNSANHTPGTILVVDDAPANLRLLFQMLSKANYKVNLFKNGPAALTSTQVEVPDLILLDIGLPEMNGYEIANHLKNCPATADIPIIFISALDHVEAKVKAFEIGGADYITKPFHEAEVMARVKTQLDLRRYHQMKLRSTLESEKTRLLTTFIDKAAHEFRTPLTTIATSSDILQRLVAGEIEKSHKFLKTIQSGVQDISHLLDDMLSIVELETADRTNFKRIDMGNLVKGMVEQYQLRGTHDVQLLIENDGPFAVQGTHSFLIKAIDELLDNAAKFSPAAGQIVTRLAVQDQQVVFEIQDSGPGIEAHDLPHVFDQFYRADQVHTSRGFGLGLPITRRIIEMHGGKIGLQSTSGGGARVTMTLPLDPA